jgi:hypothetical protein
MYNLVFLSCEGVVQLLVAKLSNLLKRSGLTKEDQGLYSWELDSQVHLCLALILHQRNQPLEALPLRLYKHIFAKKVRTYMSHKFHAQQLANFCTISPDMNNSSFLVLQNMKCISKQSTGSENVDFTQTYCHVYSQLRSFRISWHRKRKHGRPIKTYEKCN